jgi:hypothetical protein
MQDSPLGRGVPTIASQICLDLPRVRVSITLSAGPEWYLEGLQAAAVPGFTVLTGPLIVDHLPMRNAGIHEFPTDHPKAMTFVKSQGMGLGVQMGRRYVPFA